VNQNGIIRPATEQDFEYIWPIFHDIVAAGETYAYERDTNFEQARNIWLTTARETFVFERNGKILGSYYLKTNQAGPGKHVCNCGYMVSSTARSQGLAAAMCQHSQQIAIELGYRAMQFNCVAASNEGAIMLWKKLGFTTVGCLPKAFNHPSKGFVDAFVMFKCLQA
jgi:L-amino acid N-acyltransferase YncA